MKLSGRRALVLVEDMYQELELWYPLLRLREEGAKVFVVGPKKQEYRSKLGYPAPADMAAEDVDVSAFDAVVIPGGYAPDLMRRHPAMVRIVSEAVRQGKVVGAICHAGWMLASAGVLKGRRATCFFAIRDDVANAGALYEDAEVVVDQNLVTSRKPDDLPAFMREIVRLMAAG